MGLEAETTCTYSGKTFAVKALLESTELILRGELKRKLPITALKHVTAQGPALTFEAKGERYSLTLGERTAAAWGRKITTPPPSLAAKLGVSDGSRALVIGALDEAELTAALKGHVTDAKDEAAFSIAIIRSEGELTAVLKAHGGASLPLWLANIKGANSPFSENAIRAVMRGAGFMDVKICAVSATLSATRYLKAR